MAADFSDIVLLALDAGPRRLRQRCSQPQRHAFRLAVSISEMQLLADSVLQPLARNRSRAQAGFPPFSIV